MERFADKGTEDIYDGLDSKQARRTVSTTAKNAARRKLLAVVAATSLRDLAVMPQNRLELHKEGGKYNGLHSVRVNDQYRVFFRWTDQGAAEIFIADYHG